jgi:hypothetical protein
VNRSGMILNEELSAIFERMKSPVEA